MSTVEAFLKKKYSIDINNIAALQRSLQLQAQQLSTIQSLQQSITSLPSLIPPIRRQRSRSDQFCMVKTEPPSPTDADVVEVPHKRSQSVQPRQPLPQLTIPSAVSCKACRAGCLKAMCPCYKAGKMCGSECHCIGCQNGQASTPQLSSQFTHLQVVGHHATM